jgi:hypothetical protein
MDTRFFDSWRDYAVPLLKLLEKYPDGGECKAICALFEREYRRQIPPEHNITNFVNTRWANRLGDCRGHLRKDGRMVKGIRNLWKITEKGQQWLRDHPDATRY